MYKVLYAFVVCFVSNTVEWIVRVRVRVCVCVYVCMCVRV